MSFFSTTSGVAVVDSRTRSGTITLPLTTQIPNRYLQIKDLYGAFARSSLTVSTQTGESFDDGMTSKVFTDPFTFLTLYAASTTKWAQLGGTQTISQTISSLNVSSITIGSGYGWLQLPPIQTVAVSTNAIYTDSATANSTTSGYISAQILYVSSIMGATIGGGDVTRANLASTVQGLGTAGYLSSVSGATGFVSALTVNTLTLGSGSGWLQLPPLQTVYMSSIYSQDQALYSLSTYLGNTSTTTALQFYGLDGNYNNTVLAEVSTGAGTQELLVFKGSSISDRIRMQTTGNFIIETGVSARVWSGANITTNSNVTPAFIVNTSSNVGIQTATPATTLDVAGTGRFQTLSTLALNLSSVNGGLLLSVSNLTSTTQGIFTSGLISSPNLLGLISSPNLLGFISSANLQNLISTQNILGLVSTANLQNLISTQNILGFVSTANLTNLISTPNLIGLVSTANLTNLISTPNLIGLISSPNLLSTVDGLATAGYISTSVFISSLDGLGSLGFISSSSLISTVGGLGTAGYISSGGLGIFSSVYINLTPETAPFWDSNFPIVGYDPEPNPLALDVFGSARIIKSLYIGSTTTIIGTGGVQTQRINTTTISSATTILSSIGFLTPQAGAPVYLNLSNNSLTFNGQSLVTGNAGLISTANLQNLISTQNILGFVSTANLQNLISTQNILGFVSTANLQNLISTQNLIDLISSPNLANLISAQNILGFVSTANLQNLISTQNILEFVSTANLLNLVSTQNILGFVSTANLQNLISTQNLIDLISSPNLLNLISTQNIAGLVSSPNLQNLVSTQNIAGLVSTANLLNLVSSQNIAGFVSTANLLNLVSTQNISGLISSPNLQSLVSTPNLIGLVSTQNLFALISSQNLFGLVSTPNLLNLVSTSLLSETFSSFSTSFGSVGGGGGGGITIANLTSTITGLGSIQYISSSQLISTVAGIGSGSGSAFNGSTNTLSANRVNVSILSSQQLLTSSLVATYGTTSTIATNSVQLATSPSWILTSPIQNLAISTNTFWSDQNYMTNGTITTATISATTTNALTLGTGATWILTSPIQTAILSSIVTYADYGYLDTAYIGSISTVNTIQYYGLFGNFNNTVLAEISTGAGTQELLVFKGSSISDRVRVQTTGNFVVETGVSARLWNSTTTTTTSNATPVFIVNSSSNVGIKIQVPTETFDVVGSGRFTTYMSTQTVYSGAYYAGVFFA